jgi:hypothetical protein
MCDRHASLDWRNPFGRMLHAREDLEPLIEASDREHGSDGLWHRDEPKLTAGIVKMAVRDDE